ncbi:hypothetical protein TNCT_489761 [Trichonephila clavata]|uniref:Uncharacterized protein n=1 Tax=Trichonephila clavata TaxID=2740835 RepID=A0A8X6F7P2_TRICU|nr:hypothetical protein TNCT_489761 [Trichonephila clavata]
MIPQRRLCPQQALTLFIVDLWVPPLDSLDRGFPSLSFDLLNRGPPHRPCYLPSSTFLPEMETNLTLSMPFYLLNTGPVLCSPGDFFPENE